MRAASATRDGGSPSRLGPMVNGTFIPVISSTASRTFLDRESVAEAAVVALRRSAGEQVFDRHNVRAGKIRHMDVIANAGAVGCGIVVAKECDWRSGLRGAQQQRNEMGFRIVALARADCGVCAARVEVTKADAAQAVDLVEPIEHLLHHNL